MVYLFPVAACCVAEVIEFSWPIVLVGNSGDVSRGLCHSASSLGLHIDMCLLTCTEVAGQGACAIVLLVRDKRTNSVLWSAVLNRAEWRECRPLCINYI